MPAEPNDLPEAGAVLGLDHVALPMQDAEAMIGFYRALGLEVTETPYLVRVQFGTQMVNFHRPELWRPDFELRAPAATPPCGDLCVVWDGSATALDALLKRTGASVIEGPTEREGGRRTTGSSVYVRDPDGNLLEFIRYPDRVGPDMTDEMAITALVHSYAFLVDAGDVDAVAALFEQATWRSDASDVVRHGSAAVRPVYEQLTASVAASRTKHLLTNLTVEVQPGATAASSRCDWSVLRSDTEDRLSVTLSGRYIDRFAKVDGRWRFADRLITTDPVAPS